MYFRDQFAPTDARTTSGVKTVPTNACVTTAPHATMSMARAYANPVFKGISVCTIAQRESSGIIARKIALVRMGGIADRLMGLVCVVQGGLELNARRELAEMKLMAPTALK